MIFNKLFVIADYKLWKHHDMDKNCINLDDNSSKLAGQNAHRKKSNDINNYSIDNLETINVLKNAFKRKENKYLLIGQCNKMKYNVNDESNDYINVERELNNIKLECSEYEYIIEFRTKEEMILYAKEIANKNMK